MLFLSQDRGFVFVNQEERAGFVALGPEKGEIIPRGACFCRHYLLSVFFSVAKNCDEKKQVRSPDR